MPPGAHAKRRPAAQGAAIVVTGAAGFIGSHTCDLLLASGRRVVGVDNFRTGRRGNLAGALACPGFSLVEADVAEPGVLSAITASARPAAIIHLAALVSVQESVADPALNFRLNVQATQMAAEAARLNGVPRLVFASSAAVYGEGLGRPLREDDLGNPPISPYGAAKLASETLLLGHAASYGLVVRCQRYFNVYGPRQDPASPYSGVISIFARAFCEGLPVTVYGDGRQTRDFVSVHDVARANVLAATRARVRTGVANICTGRETTLLRLAGIFQARHPGALLPRHAPARRGDIRRSVGNPSRARIQLGFRAAWTVDEGLGELIGAAP
jgi:UDP-glucose 4-epimerase